MKTFRHELIEFTKLLRIDSDTGRTYQLPSGVAYPSVTTVIGKFSDKSGLENWIKRVGEQEAAHISRRSANRGTKIHDLAEQYVLNQPVDMKSQMPIIHKMFGQIKRTLDAHVDDIHASEAMLYSDKLKVAGSVDLVAKFDGVLSIVDFKTSIKNKNKDWITDYFLQCTIYAYMFWERTGILIKDIVVVIAVEEENECQIFHEKVVNYIDRVFEICKKYHK